MAANENNLTHDEIWDDSTLVDSWNEALEEYKVRIHLRFSQRLACTGPSANRFVQKYHSIHTKGGNVNDLINEKSAIPSPPDLGYRSKTDVMIMIGRVRMPRASQSLYPSREIPVLTRSPLVRENRTW